MKSQNQAQIYKSHLRGHTENDEHRLYATLNFGSYNDPARKPFGNLLALNDETLAPDKSLSREASPGESVILLPMVGALEYYYNDEDAQVLVPGEAGIISLHGKEQALVNVKNPYDDELINFLFISLSAPLSHAIPVVELKFEAANVLHPFAGNFGGVFCYAGIFDGRKEGIYKIKKAGHGIFVFVVNGAFEVSGRLLEGRDGLGLWDVQEIDFEALSENAILLVLEVPM